jgi:large subunit ribosomal protein L23
MQKLRQDKPGSKRPSPRKWFRPKPIKKMMVEMERPFAWPAELKKEDLEKWDKKMFDEAAKDREENEELYRPDAREKPTRERKSMKEQARELLEGKESWRGERTEEQWEDVGEAVEVESEVEVAKVDKDIGVSNSGTMSRQ